MSSALGEILERSWRDVDMTSESGYSGFGPVVGGRILRRTSVQRLLAEDLRTAWHC